MPHDEPLDTPRQSQRNLRQSAERFRTIFEHAPVMIDSFDTQGECQLWNRACVKHLGYTFDEIRSCDDPMALFYPDPVVRAEALKTIAASDGIFREYKPLAKDGSERTQLWADFRLPDGTRISVGHDITARKISERALHESEERYRALFNLATNGIVLIDEESGKIVECNPEFERQTGRTFDELETMQIWQLGPSSAPASAEEARVTIRDGCEGGSNTRYFERPNGVIVPIDFKSKRVMIGDRAFLQSITVDITEREKVEEKLRLSERKLRALASRLQNVREEEAAIIAREIHDELGQTLTGLKMDISWIRRRMEEMPDDDLSLQVKDRLGSMSAEVDDTIRSVRRISTKLRPVILDDLGLHRAIEWQAREFESRTGISCRVDTEADKGTLDSDRSTAVFRIFQEILTNVARHASATTVAINLLDADGIFVLDVLDDGKGISDDDLKSTRALGILGMQERAQVCGGSVAIRREVGKGTRVVVKVPVG